MQDPSEKGGLRMLPQKAFAEGLTIYLVHDTQCRDANAGTLTVSPLIKRS